jgi:hypothetical protein
MKYRVGARHSMQNPEKLKEKRENNREQSAR